LEYRFTKSSFVRGMNCPKALFLDKFHRELKSPLSEFEKKLLDDGNAVGQAARKAFPEGHLIEEANPLKAVEATQKALQEGKLILFEAAIIYEDVLVRADILKRDSVDSPWSLYEVKATTMENCTKDQTEEYRRDIAIQLYVLKKSGWNVGRYYLMHLNSECKFPNLENLFSFREFTLELDEILEKIPEVLEELRETIEEKAPPTVDIGKHCLKPRDCPFKAHCWNHIPEISVFNVPNNRKKWKNYYDGKIDLKELEPSDYNPIQGRMIECTVDNENFFDVKAIQKEISSWEYPLIYFDFESYNPAIPCYPGTSPFQQIPFQFSCHTEEQDGNLSHSEYLHEDASDPREPLIKALIEKVPKNGSIVTYYVAFEGGRIKELIRDFPEYTDDLQNIYDRLVDLHPVMKNHVYLPDFKGSFSIKYVAPALLGETASYKDMPVADGTQTMVAFQKLIQMKSSKAKDILKRDMLEYCKKDTLLMVLIKQNLMKMYK
jgi:predicted RecB family nuclease